MRIAPSLLSSRVVVAPASDERVSRSTPRQSHLAEAIAQEKVSVSQQALQKLRAALEEIDEQKKQLLAQQRQEEKSRAMARVAELKQRLEMLQKLAVGLPPAAAKALAAQLKDIAQQLRGAVQQYASAGGGESPSLHVSVSGGQEAQTGQNTATANTATPEAALSAENQAVDKAEAADKTQTETGAAAEEADPAEADTPRVTVSYGDAANQQEKALDQQFRQLVAEATQRLKALAALLKAAMNQQDRQQLSKELNTELNLIAELTSQIDS